MYSKTLALRWSLPSRSSSFWDFQVIRCLSPSWFLFPLPVILLLESHNIVVIDVKLKLFYCFQSGQLDPVHCTDSCGDLRQPPSPLLPWVRPLSGNLPVTAHSGCSAQPWWPLGRSLSVCALPGREHQRTEVLQIHQGVWVCLNTVRLLSLWSSVNM